MNLTLITACTNEFWEFAEVTLPGKVRYCLRWKHPLIARKHLSMPWGERQQILLDELPKCDWLWFTGADVLLTNLTVDAAQFCDQDYHMVIGTERATINNDSFFIRNVPVSFDYLKRVIEYRDLNDQASMVRVCRDMPEFKTKIVLQRLFNAQPDSSYGYEPHPDYNWEPGDFVFHPHGLPLNNRIIAVRDKCSVWKDYEHVRTGCDEL